MNSVPRIPPMATKVSAAFLDLGSWNAGIPLLTASVPVIAEHPLANACSKTTRPNPPAARAASAVDCGWALVTAVISDMSKCQPVKIAKTAPDSFNPRRFAKVKTAIDTRHQATRC